MKKNKFPKNWDEDRVRKVLAHYEKQTEEEAAYENRTQTAMDIPVQLVPKVRELIAKHQAL